MVDEFIKPIVEDVQRRAATKEASEDGSDCFLEDLVKHTQGKSPLISYGHVPSLAERNT